jgi:hypothetical protein
MNLLKRIGCLSLVLTGLMACESGSSNYERRVEAAREREATALQAALAEFPAAQDLDEVDVKSLYSAEVEAILTRDDAIWLYSGVDLDVEAANERYLLTFAGPWVSDADYYVQLSAQPDLIRPILQKPREERDRSSYLVVFRVTHVSKPRLQLGSEVEEYDEFGAITNIVFQEVSARILHGELFKAIEY